MPSRSIKKKQIINETLEQNQSSRLVKEKQIKAATSRYKKKTKDNYTKPKFKPLVKQSDIQKVFEQST